MWCNVGHVTLKMLRQRNPRTPPCGRGMLPESRGQNLALTVLHVPPAAPNLRLRLSGKYQVVRDLAGVHNTPEIPPQRNPRTGTSSYVRARTSTGTRYRRTSHTRGGCAPVSMPHIPQYGNMPPPPPKQKTSLNLQNLTSNFKMTFIRGTQEFHVLQSKGEIPLVQTYP